MNSLCPAGSTPIKPPSLAQYAVRHGQWKLIVLVLPVCLAPNDCQMRLYQLAVPTPPHHPGIELPDGSEGVWNPLTDVLPAQAQAEFVALKAELFALLASQPVSLADGNLDGVVDAADLVGVFSEWGSMGFWDATQDGIVNGDDLSFVLNAWGADPVPIDQMPACLLPDGLAAGVGK